VRIFSQQTGPVFTELTTTCALPTCPRIVQTVRLYHDLRMIDIVNTVTKEEIFTPDGLYFAFPLALDSPEFNLQVADAVMRPGKEQLPLSCMDFYSIQHWAAVQGDNFGIIMVPMDAPLVVLSDLNVYKWADHIDFNRGHIYSFVMNNYWCTNFRGGQKGDLTFRYRLTSSEGAHDPVRATHFAWQKFHPLQAVWLTSDPVDNATVSQSLLRIEGDPVILSCLKAAENGEGIIIRLLEQNGKPAKCTLAFDLPGGRRLLGASYANAVERPIKSLLVTENTVKVELRANEIVTVVVMSGDKGL
jgi:alpha-mannosidase